MSLKPLRIRRPPRLGGKVSRDTDYWATLQHPVTVREFGAVSDVDFCDTQPNLFAVTASTKVQIFNTATDEVVKTLSSFKDVAYSGCFRGDGQLLVAGGEEGMVRLFQVSSKSVLRSFRNSSSSRPVHKVKFATDNTHLFTGADDNSVSYWDIPGQTVVSKFTDHQDYVRSVDVCTSNPDLVVSGSYDHHCKLYDVRTESCVLDVDHGSPVESVLLLPAANMIVTAGGNCVRVWDCMTGGRLITSMYNHHRTITSLTLNSQCDRLFSASLDRHVKIYDMSLFKVVHSVDYASPLLSVGVSRDQQTIVCGTTDGLVSIRHRKQLETCDQPPSHQSRHKQRSCYRYFIKGKSFLPSKDAHVVVQQKKYKMSRYDNLLRGFQHSKALDRAMDLRVRSNDPDLTVSVIRELIRRKALHSALIGRNEKQLMQILVFLRKNVVKREYSDTLLDVCVLVLQLYTSVLGESVRMAAEISKLHECVQKELQYQQLLLGTMGKLEALFTASATSTPPLVTAP